ncbi:hypothetical protein NDR87_18785 [Nocardia sp. CDC159]|uniref:Uncharacterized protein n=1 Tax=Nocardia pulmonis TaxID=2951408 RepID=A0A9X2EDK2_9NOCA|nr:MULTISPECIES: hypothetical protein [Nocardia]MCM6776263.1 hypothetical protein [Nocardia pulmonis]MCM6788411.1 hypothetical protein [Nocardia sp. CDC159]
MTTAGPEPQFGPFLESLYTSHRRREDIEAERQALAERFEAVVDDGYHEEPPRRAWWPIRTVVTFFRTLNGMRKMLGGDA